MGLGGAEISVIGAGVAGLSVARAAARAGADVAVYEQAPGITEVGAGLQISPNGFRVLDALGLGDALRAVSVRAMGVLLRDGVTGREVLRLDVSDAHAPYHFVHRARLIDLLAEGAEAEGVALTCGARLDPGQGAGLVFAADGLRSTHRAHLNGRAEPAFTGQIAWRAVIPDDRAEPVAQVFMGAGRHLVSYPLAGGLRNIVAVEERTDWAEEGWQFEDDPARLARAFSGFTREVRDWLARVEKVHLWGLFQHPVAPLWHGDGITLLGDAAHPMLPFMAQGANMALEDAWALVACLDDPAKGPEAYQAMRAPRVSRVVTAAQGNARNYHLSGVRRHIAHSLLRVAGRVAPKAPIRRFDWLYGFDVAKNINESDD